MSFEIVLIRNQGIRNLALETLEIQEPHSNKRSMTPKSERNFNDYCHFT